MSNPVPSEHLAQEMEPGSRIPSKPMTPSSRSSSWLVQLIQVRIRAGLTQESSARRAHEHNTVGRSPALESGHFFGTIHKDPGENSPVAPVPELRIHFEPSKQGTSVTM